MPSIIFALCVYLGLQLSHQTEELKFNTQDFPPFSYQIEGVVAGPAADIIRAVCNELKIYCFFDILPWKRAQREVKSGKAQGLFVIGWNKARSEWLYFSPPLLITQYGFFVHKDNPLQYQTPSDIAGRVVGVYSPSNTADALEKMRNQMIEKKLRPIAVQKVHDDVLAFRMLDRGDRGIDAVFSNRDVGMMIIRREHLRNVRYSGAQMKLKYYIGFSQKHIDRKLVNDFNEAFRQLHKAGVVHEILADYGLEAAALE